MKKGINVLSLFDGISCGQLALKRSKIKVKNYYASEIDKHAINICVDNFPETKHIGDIKSVKPSDLENIDLVIGGSPCQSFSRSGNGEGFDGKSGLFWEFIRVLAEAKALNPDVKFLLENVIMRKEWENIITAAIGVRPIKIDSCLVSAQKRQRLYWTNIKNIKQPKDLDIKLSDIVIGDREVINDHVLILYRYNNGSMKIRNATKKGFLIANNGDSVNLEVPKSKTRRGRVGIGKTNTLNTACNYGMVRDGDLIRLNISDYEKLQTIDVDYTSYASDNQRKKAIGNGWTVDVIVGFFNELNTK